MCEHNHHLVQVGGDGVFPSRRELRVIDGGDGKLVHPFQRRLLLAQEVDIVLARRQLQLQLPHEVAELPHDELQFRGLLGAVYL